MQRVASGPILTFGSRFDSSLRNKSHIKPVKKDGPGPGSYKLPSSIRSATALERPSFGTSARGFRDVQNTPAPN